jgi:hypothetical protein
MPEKLWFPAIALSFVFLLIAIRIIHDAIVFKYFPCKAGDASHDWTHIGKHHRYCKRCPKRQSGEEYTPGLGIVAEGETWTRWRDVA